MSTLKGNLLELVDSTLELLNEAEQTIEVRGAIKYAKQVRGCLSQCSDDIGSIGEVLTDSAADMQKGLISDTNPNDAPNDNQDTLKEEEEE